MAAFHIVIEVRLREGIADPEGATIEKALPALGFSGVSAVRAGKCFRLTVQAESREHALDTAHKMCERLLANPVMEDVVVSIDDRG